MTLSLGSASLEFVPVQLRFRDGALRDVFARYNRKTVAETMRTSRYARLQGEVQERYVDRLNQKLGEFLKALKEAEDPFYQKFLNKYGDAKYCEFSLAQSPHSTKCGLYAFAVAEEVKYIGKTTLTFKKRINDGYGRVDPKNCYLDGQATNCHLNTLIASVRDRVGFYVCPMEDKAEITRLETELLQEYRPE